MTPPATRLTVSDARRRTADRLRAGSDQADAEADWLLCRVLHCPRSRLAVSHRDLTDSERTELDRMAARMTAGEPLQYVLGETDFMGRRFRCDARALIPRPETEQLVEWMLDDSSLWNAPTPFITDLGTGSGCIVISLALARPDGRYQGVDLEPAALALARENAGDWLPDGTIEWVQSDLLTGLNSEPRNAIVANLPYVAESDWPDLPRPVREFEPRSALVAAEDGLALINRLIRDAVDRLTADGRLYLEIGEQQQKPVHDMLMQRQYRNIEFRHDLAGRIRHVRAEAPQ